MITIKAVLRKWGRSMGIVISKEVIKEKKLKAGDEVNVLILKKTDILDKTFGALKLKRSSQEMLKEIDEEGWNE